MLRHAPERRPLGRRARAESRSDEPRVGNGLGSRRIRLHLAGWFGRDQAPPVVRARRGCTRSSDGERACGVPKLGSCLQIADFSGHVSSFCTPHAPRPGAEGHRPDIGKPNQLFRCTPARAASRRCRGSRRLRSARPASWPTPSPALSATPTKTGWLRFRPRPARSAAVGPSSRERRPVGPGHSAAAC
jgi:hypothetical protein